MKAAGEVCAVLEKYGRGMTSKCYAEQTALTESLLEDLGKATEKIAALAGVAELVAQLREAQVTFAAAYDGYIRAKAGKGESASSFKKPLVALINDGIVPYLNIVAAMAENIKRTNDIVAPRRAGKKAE